MPFCATACTGRPVMFSPAKKIWPAVGFRDAGDEVEHRRFAGAVGPDHGANLARLDGHVDVVDGDQRAEAADQPLHSSSGIGGFLAAAVDRAISGFALEPAGQDSPDALGREHDEGDEDRAEDERPQVGDLRKLCSTKTNNTPPMIGPIKVPAPPMITMISTRPEVSQKNSSGDAKPAKPAYSAPASPPKP